MMPLDLERIQDSPHLLDLLIQMEDVLDSLDVYVFKNWYLGEIVEGPTVRRYWLDFTLKYAYDKMPDPKAALRLLKHDVRVDFWKAKLADGEFVDAEDTDDHEGNPMSPVGSVDQGGHAGNPPPAPQGGMGTVPLMQAESDPAKSIVWLVRISIPRRLATQMAQEEMDFYDEEVDVDDVEDANDSGIDDESAYMSDDQAPQGEADPNAPGDGAPPPGGPNQPPAQGGGV
jgi:hypothetical protein